MSNMGNQWAYRRIDGPKPSCHQISQPGMSYRQHNRSERESLLRSRPYCLDILEWRESGICKSWKFPWDLGVVFRRSHQDEMLQFRKNCFPSTPSKAHQDSLAPWVCTSVLLFPVLNLMEGERNRKMRTETGVVLLGYQGTSQLLYHPLIVFLSKAAFMLALGFWNSKMTYLVDRAGNVQRFCSLLHCSQKQLPTEEMLHSTEHAR